MATVEFPSPGLFATVLHAFRSADPRERTVNSALADIVSSLTSDEAEQLPAAIGGVLALLRGDVDRLRFAADALVRFDMFTAADSLVDLAVAVGDRDLLLSAAALCGNPGVNASLRQRLSDTVSGDPAARLRLYESSVPRSGEEALVYEQRWPGARSGDRPFRLAPVVVLDAGMAAKTVLDLGLRLVEAGAVVRRLGNTAAMPNWFGPQTVVVCRPPTRSRILSTQPKFPERRIIVDPDLKDGRDYARLLRRIDSALPSRSDLRLVTLEAEPSTLLWDPDVYTLGVYETREAAFLTAAPTSSLYDLAKRGLLRPRCAGVKVWAFSDLVAVRTWCYLKAQSKKQVRSAIVPALAQFAGDPQAVRVGATSGGNVLVDRGDGWVDIQTGEQLLDFPITDLDDAFRPFSLGGRQAPHLLHASENTRLHPAVLHGVPHLKNHRITARALAELDDRGGEQAIVAAYPELEGVQISDTVSVGHQLVGAR